jgi:hypothetical protein
MRRALPALILAAIAGFAVAAPSLFPAEPEPRRPAPTSSLTAEPAAPAQPGDPVQDAAAAAVLAWQARDEPARQAGLTEAATEEFTDAMVGVDPADVPQCSPTALANGPAAVSGAARVRVTCDTGDVLHVDLLNTGGRWRAASILPGA